jgi:hypothetical protein
LKLRSSGLNILCTPDITVYHYESKSRGLDHLDPKKRARNAAERGNGGALEAAMTADSSVNPVWHMATLPIRLLSASTRPRLWAHIERCAAANPWLPETGQRPSQHAEWPGDCARLPAIARMAGQSEYGGS